MEISSSRPDEDDVRGKAPEIQTATGKSWDAAGSSQDVASSSQSLPTPVVLTKEHFVHVVRNTICYWVYARFFDKGNFVTQSLYALDIKENCYVRLPNQPTNFFSENASAVLDYNLYVIGGRRDSFLSNFVHLFDPVLHKWSDTTFTTVERKEAHAASVDGRIYVFGGCNKQNPHWAEVYEPASKKWRGIPKSEVLTEAFDRGLNSIWASAVLGKKIILRGFRTGIAFDLMSRSWTHVSDKLIQGWWRGIRAAVVQNLLITCYGDMDRPQMAERRIRAYDPDHDVWLQIVGIDNSFHEQAQMSEFFSVNGKLVMYHMWEPDDLRFSVFEINEILPATVRASLLWQSRFPITTIINAGKELHPQRLRRSVYKHSLVEAFRPDE